MRNLKITFLLPAAGAVPCGGFKVVYEYANHLSRRGHKVTVIHTALLLKDTPWKNKPRRAISYIGHRILGSYSPANWFPIDPRVRLLWVPSLHQRYIPDADVIVATAWQTAEWAGLYPPSKGRRLYLIQDLEDWECSITRLYATWRSPMKKIVISRWLKEIADNLGEESAYIPNGLDFDRFAIDTPPEQRDPFHVMMLYHLLDSKGVADGLEALSITQRRVPNLRVTLFGTPPKPAGLPDWIHYHRRPPQTQLRQLYNEASIFVAPSWREGWGLTPCEAMMSGATVAATDNGGHREFAIHEQTALLSPPKAPEELAENVIRLIHDSHLRVQLARQANLYVKRFGWEKSVDAFETCLVKWFGVD
jgi:glycosyltransferase involved in cell wall biosynthesis